MKKGNNSTTSALYSYLNEISIDSKDLNLRVDVEKYLKGSGVFGALLNKGPVCPFILDYRTKGYYYVGETSFMMLGLPSEAFLEGGIPFLHNQMFKEDLHVFSNIFAHRLQHIKSVSNDERGNYWYSVNYRMRDVRGKTVHVLQQFTVLEVNDEGSPLVLMGYCTDLTDYKGDNKMVDAIYKWDDVDGLNLVKRDVYFPELEHSMLSRRETEILKWMFEGLSSKVIADKLFISAHTVNTHRKNMLEKTNAKNTADLLKFACTNGIL